MVTMLPSILYLLSMQVTFLSSRLLKSHSIYFLSVPLKSLNSPLLKSITPLLVQNHYQLGRPIMRSCLRKSTKKKLVPVDHVLSKYPKLKGESSAGTLANKISQEAIFGKAVMKRCTPLGSRDLPALPTKELYDLKVAMFKQYPQYWRSSEFKGLWNKCLVAVQQKCKHLRLEKD